jgi:hypothetical protein
MGEALIEQRTARAFQVTEAALRGDDLRSMPRYPNNNADALSVSEESRRLALERCGKQRGEIERWLQQNP